MHTLNSTVTLVNLKRSAHLNGRVGRITAHVMASGFLARYLVAVEGEANVLSVRAENVIRLGVAGAIAEKVGLPSAIIELVERVFPNV